MGAACCRSQRSDDPLLSLSRVSGSASVSFYMSTSLASYVSFIFKPTDIATQGFKSHDKKQRKSQKKHKPRMVAMPYVGEHWRKTARGTFTPLTLLELSVRSICIQLLVYQQDALDASVLPPEMASKILQWLRQHDILDKPHFQALAPFLLVNWNLADQQEVEDSWFDKMPETTLERVKSIDVSGCIHLQHLGSKRQLTVKMPELITASFRGCSELSRESIEMLEFSTKLAAIDLSGCVKLNDKSLRKVSKLKQLKSLQLTGCRELTDKGVNHLLTLTVLEKLRAGRCDKLTHEAFKGFATSFSKLRELDVAYCRLSDKAMQHIGRIRSLEVLVIRGCQRISNNSMASLSGMTSLKYFDARHCSKIHSIPTEWTELRVLLLGYTAFAESDTAILQCLTGLHELEVRKCRIGKRGFQLISRLNHLEKLDLGETPLTDSGLLEICNATRNLKALNISDTEVSDDGTSGLAKLKELRILHLDTQGITNKAMANVSFLSQLERLDLFGANITDNGLSHLVHLHKPQELTLCGGKISDRGVEIISKLTSLTSLNLSQNRNIGPKALFYLRSLTCLRRLNLSNTGISALSLRHLCPLKKLQFLSVYGCSLSEGEIDVLREILPELKCLRCT